MSISIAQMRGQLKTLYKGAYKWVDNMQGYTIYMRMLESGRFSKD